MVMSLQGRWLWLLATVWLCLTPLSVRAQQDCPTDTRAVTHAMGVSCVAEAPQRVVVLDTGELDNALALGATIVGAPVADAQLYQEYLAGQLDGITDIGAISMPNLEAILTLSPDLILGSKQRYEAVYDQLSAIAPTVFTESLRVPWQTNFALHAEALGRTSEADVLLAAYDARVADVQAALGDERATLTVSVIRFRPGQVRLYLKSSFIGYILQDVGLARPASQDEDVFSAEISLEQVQAVDADVVFVTGYAQDDSELAAFLESPLWQTLGAVQNARVIDVDDDTWIAGLGVQAALAVLDDLALHLVTSDTADAPDAVATFPVTVQHKFGSTTITQAPQRVVAIGYTEQDYLLAVGVTPIAVRSWYADESIAFLPWAEDEAAGATPQVLVMPFGNLNYEAILALQPDLISAVTAGLSAEEYETLAQIAPTIAQSGDYVNFGMPWQEITRMVGAAVAQAALAEERIAAVEALFAEARAENPAFEGSTIAVAYNYGEARTYGYYTDQDGRGRFFTDLGFVVPDALNRAAGESFFADISAERIDLFEQDVLVFLGLGFADGGQAAIESDPLISQLDVARDGRIVYIPAEYDDALQYSSVLSLEFALEGIVPLLRAAVGADDAATGTAAAYPLTVEHALGTTTLQQAPLRVVALEWTYVESLLALGVQPVGVADIGGYNNWVDIPVALDASVVDVGTRQEPNLELIASLQPDLIIASSFRVGETYEALAAIAPTLAFDAYPTDKTHYEEMVGTFSTIARALGRTDEGDAVLAALDAYLADAEAILVTAGRADDTFVLAQAFVSSDVPTFRLFTDNALAVQVLMQIGLDNAWDEPAQPFGFSTVTYEGMGTLGDTNFFVIAQEADLPALTGTAVWQQLPFVQAERDTWLGAEVWLFGGPLSMQTLVATVLAALDLPTPTMTQGS